MQPKITISDQPGPAAGAVLVEAIEQVVAERGRCRLALSGGSAPGPVMQYMAEHLSPACLETLAVTWIDERHVPMPDGDGDWTALHPDSNLRLAWEHWWSRTPVVPALVPMARRGSLREAVAAFERDFLDQISRLDVALLGVGPDGHIASLFPGHPLLEATGTCVAVTDSPKPPPERLTLTLPVLEDLDHAILVANGEGKADVLRRALDGDDSIPLGRYRPQGSWRWILDPAAGSRLPVSEGSS